MHGCVCVPLTIIVDVIVSTSSPGIRSIWESTVQNIMHSLPLIQFSSFVLLLLRLDSEHSLVEVDLALERPLQVFRLAEPVSLALEEDVLHLSAALLHSLDNPFGLRRRYDGVIGSLEDLPTCGQMPVKRRQREKMNQKRSCDPVRVPHWTALAEDLWDLFVRASYEIVHVLALELVCELHQLRLEHDQLWT
jgi:hypothetical protein